MYTPWLLLLLFYVITRQLRLPGRTQNRSSKVIHHNHQRRKNDGKNKYTRGIEERNYLDRERERGGGAFLGFYVDRGRSLSLLLSSWSSSSLFRQTNEWPPWVRPTTGRDERTDRQPDTSRPGYLATTKTTTTTTTTDARVQK